MSNEQIAVECSNCIAYVELPNTGGQGGECHAAPPSVVVIPSKVLSAQGKEYHINTVFPPVPRNSWCCHFNPRIKPVAVSEENVSH